MSGFGFTAGSDLVRNAVESIENSEQVRYNPDNDRIGYSSQTQTSRDRFAALNDVGRIGAESVEQGLEAQRRLGITARQLEAAANRVGEDKAVAEARTRANAGVAADRGTFERRTATFSATERQKNNARRRFNLRGAVARDAATTGVRRNFTTQQKAARRVGQSFSDALSGQILSAEGGVSSAEASTMARRAQEDAASDAQWWNLAGTIGGAALSIFLSSEEAKDKKGKPEGLLDKLKKVRVDRWNYKGDEQEHIGPYAEEFNDTFETGKEHRHGISVIDAVGVALGAIKELDKKVEARG